MSDAYVSSAVRTPFGRSGAALSDVRAAPVLGAVVARAPGLDPGAVGVLENAR